MQIKDVCVFVANILAWFLRAVFHDDYLKIFERLLTKAFEQFVHLVRAVEDGNDDRILHRALLLSTSQIAAVAGVNLNEVALVDEQGNAHLNASLQCGGLQGVGGCVALDARL